jgi:hypothetical protein|nr:MAG TPA: hypothetical protein [Caudoviricetes sp.]
MRIENLYPKPVREDFATCAQVRDDAAATYATKARDLLDRSGGDAIGAISLLMLAADQRKAAEAAEPTLSEQALAATVREQRDTIDTLKGQVDLYRGQWKTAVDESVSIFADLCQQEVNADRITALESILRAVTATAYGRARMYSHDLWALPNGTVVRDEAGRAWTRIDDEDGVVWATPTRDDTLSSNDLAEETTAWMAWVADK